MELQAMEDSFEKRKVVGCKLGTLFDRQLVLSVQRIESAITRLVNGVDEFRDRGNAIL